ncbi:uncharacterized protein LOC111059427 isoform X2 [Nilaparvata lugens]|nr:uncharacterized protein LOC111059427 isoform X2 [Nilaparvata lugens]
MSRDRRWWSVPRVGFIPSFNLWRTSEPIENVETNIDEDNEGNESPDKKETANNESEQITTTGTPVESENDSDVVSRKIKLRRSPSKRTSNRSRSSSLSNSSQKSTNLRRDRASLPPEMNKDEEKKSLDLSGMPEISFSFFNDRDDEFIIVADTIPVNAEVPAKKENRELNREDSEDSYASTSGDVLEEGKSPSAVDEPRSDECDGSSLPDESSPTDYRVQLATEPPPSPTIRHVSTVTITVKLVEPAEGDNDYEELSETTPEPRYASPRNSTITITPVVDNVPVYATVDKSGKKYETVEGDIPEAPEIPQPDWDPDSNNEGDYAELAVAPEVDNTNQSTIMGSYQPEEVLVGRLVLAEPKLKTTYSDQADFQYHPNQDYKTNLRRARLLRARRGSVIQRASILRVRSKLGRAWKSVKSWWLEERLRFGDVILKQAHEQAVRPDSRSVNKEVDDDAALKEDGEDEEEDDTFDDSASNAFSDGNTTLSRQTLRRHRPSSPPPSISRSSSIINFRRSRICTEGQNGFEELRRYIKQGEDFCKDLTSILQERSEAETQYAKTLSKLSAKLLKATKEAVGTVNQAWQKVAIEMETQSEAHRSLGNSLSEEVVKPLRQLIESQHRIRKSVETSVDKTGKSLAEWRSAESKSKKQSFQNARENEKMQDAMLEIRLATPNNTKLSTSTLHLHSQKVVSDKENAKMESKRKKAEESVKKADVEYYTYCIRAERARLEWESAVTRGSQSFQTIEEERLQHLKDVAMCYLHHFKDIGPKLVQSAERLQEPIQQCDINHDMETVISLKGAGQTMPEQLLPDFYAEHITLAMNKERRRQALYKILQLIRQDLERERRGKQGVENLARALKQTPNFGTEDSQQNVTEKLHHMRSMLAYLEAARYKVQSSVCELEGQPKSNHPLSSHIQVTRDRQGFQQSILKLPPWVRTESVDIVESPDWTDRGAADGNSVQPDSDFDEFSSQGSEKDYQNSVLSQYHVPTQINCNQNRCKALYHYAANLYDELNLTPGDVINIHEKQADGWWLGELNGTVGIFPATYVEEMK